MIIRLRLFLLFFLLLGSCAVGNRATNISINPDWEEHFDQASHFDTTVWSKIPRGLSDWNNRMSNDDRLYGLRDGKLILRGVKNDDLPKDTSVYITGGVYTKGKKSFGMGRLEIRAKLGAARGAWPAFWMLGENVKYPNGGEIDIMERLNGDSIAYQTVHSYYTIHLGIKDHPPQGSTGSIDPDDFNTYAVEMLPDSLVFYINDKKTFTYPRIETDQEEQFPFADYKHYLLLDMQLGGSWVGKVELKDLPVEMEIDWVKFYNLETLKK